MPRPFRSLPPLLVLALLVPAARCAANANLKNLPPPESGRVFAAAIARPDAPLEAFFDHKLGAQLDEASIRATVHVDPAGVGGAHRSIAAAWPEVIKNLERGKPTKLLLAPGVYREAMPVESVVNRPEVRDTLLVIEGAGPDKTFWSGAEETTLADWRDEGDGIYSIEWTEDWGNSASVWEAPKVPGHRSEMVFVNGALQTQVLLEWYDFKRTGKLTDHEKRQQSWTYARFRDPAATLVPGSFGVAERSENGDRIFLKLPGGVDKATARIEVARHRVPFAFADEKPSLPGKNQLVLRGVAFDRFASRTKGNGVEQFPCIGQNYTDLLLEDCAVRWHNARGIDLDGARITLRRVNASYNGMSGLAGAAADSVIEDCVTNFNNWRGAWGGLKGWNWGGVKFHGPADHQIVRRHQSIGNLAPGFWYDIHARHVAMEDMVLAANDSRGLFLELAQGPYFARRVLSALNTLQQLRVCCVGDSWIRDSIFYGDNPADEKGDGSSTAVFLYDFWFRKSGHALMAPYLPGELMTERCVFLGGPDQAVLGALINGITPRTHAEYENFERAPSGRGNRYYSASGEPVFLWNNEEFQKQERDFVGWQKHHPDRDARLGDPRFIDPAAGDFRPRDGVEARNLPAWRIDPALLEEARRFREWSEIGVRLNEAEAERPEEDGT